MATVSEPLLLVLHVGYAWLAMALALFGLAALGVAPRSAALHAMTAGTFGTMTLAVMTRATLGHTGRALTADYYREYRQLREQTFAALCQHNPQRPPRELLALG